MTEPKKRKVVLVVDDFKDAREMYREYLEFMGYDVIIAEDGQQAIELAQSGQPDLILMNLSLPMVDGLEATRQIKASADTSGIPVIALTSHVMEESAASARSAGCDDFIAKPALPNDVEAKIRRMLEGTKTGIAGLLEKAKNPKKS